MVLRVSIHYSTTDYSQYLFVRAIAAAWQVRVLFFLPLWLDGLVCLNFSINLKLTSGFANPNDISKGSQYHDKALTAYYNSLSNMQRWSHFYQLTTAYYTAFAVTIRAFRRKSVKNWNVITLRSSKTRSPWSLMLSASTTHQLPMKWLKTRNMTACFEFPSPPPWLLHSTLNCTFKIKTFIITK